MPRALTNAETKTLLDAFLKMDTMRRQKDRDWIVRQLRPEIGTTIERRDSDRLDTLMILSRSRYYDGLLELLGSINTLEAESPAFTNVMAIVHQMLPDEVPATLDDDAPRRRDSPAGSTES